MVLGDIGEDHRLLKEPLRAHPALHRPAREYFRPRLDRRVDLRADLVPLHRGHHRPYARFGVEAVPRHVRLRLLYTEPLERRFRRLLHVDSLHGAADLPAVHQTVLHRLLGRRVQVRVGEHHHRVLPAQLQHEPLQVRRARAHDLAPRRRRPRHRHHLHGAPHQRRSHRPVALHQLHHAFGEQSLQRLGDDGPRQRRDLRGLHDHRVARGERRKRQQEHLVGGKVPRRADRYHPMRVAHDDGVVARAYRSVRRFDVVQVLVLVNRPIHLLLSLSPDLAHLTHNHAHELVLPRGQARTRRLQQRNAIAERRSGPGKLRLVRAGDRGGDALGGSHGHAGDQLHRRRVGVDDRPALDQDALDHGGV